MSKGSVRAPRDASPHRRGGGACSPCPCLPLGACAGTGSTARASTKPPPSADAAAGAGGGAAAGTGGGTAVDKKGSPLPPWKQEAATEFGFDVSRLKRTDWDRYLEFKKGARTFLLGALVSSGCTSSPACGVLLTVASCHCSKPQARQAGVQVHAVQGSARRPQLGDRGEAELRHPQAQHGADQVQVQEVDRVRVRWCTCVRTSPWCCGSLHGGRWPHNPATLACARRARPVYVADHVVQQSQQAWPATFERRRYHCLQPHYHLTIIIPHVHTADASTWLTFAVARAYTYTCDLCVPTCMA